MGNKGNKGNKNQELLVDHDSDFDYRDGGSLLDKFAAELVVNGNNTGDRYKIK